MKTELATSIAAAIAGALISYFVCGLFIGPIEDVTFTTINSDLSVDLAEPDPEVFNYKTLNPTVEVFVGNCVEFNNAGECIDQPASEETQTNQDQGNP